MKYNVYFPSELSTFRAIPDVQGDELADHPCAPASARDQTAE